MIIIRNHMYFLMSSLSRKFNQHGYRKYGHAQHQSHNSELEYAEIEQCSAKILSTIKSRCSQFCSRDSQWVRILASKGYIAHTMLEMLKVLHKKPQ